MPKCLEVYKCALCGNIVEVVHAGGGELVCCGQAMGQLTENTVDAAKEKHVPVIEAPARPRLSSRRSGSGRDTWPDNPECPGMRGWGARRQPGSR